MRNIQISQIANFMGPTWGPPGSRRPHIGLMLAPWTLLSGMLMKDILTLLTCSSEPFLVASQSHNAATQSTSEIYHDKRNHEYKHIQNICMEPFRESYIKVANNKLVSPVFALLRNMGSVRDTSPQCTIIAIEFLWENLNYLVIYSQDNYHSCNSKTIIIKLKTVKHRKLALKNFTTIKSRLCYK